jgi:GNAT superfamily N-acetyltransferase
LEADLPIVAQFLSLAQQPKQKQQQPSSLSLFTPLNAWKDRIDALFAQSDIEGLIRRRWDTIQEGRKARLRALSKLQQATTYQDSNSNALSKEQDQVLLQLLWSSQSDRLRSRIAAAAAETGEDTVWRHVVDRMYCTPSSWQWLQHVQLTAATTMSEKGNDNISTDNRQGRSNAETVVGFCEIAMLEYPAIQGDNEWDVPHWMIVVDRRAEDNSLSSRNHQFANDSSSSSPASSTVCFAPAIANLAVAPTVRRRGIASQLLRSAERYVATYWHSHNDDSSSSSTMPLALGLYVEQDNVAALSLYRACGYRTVQLVPGRNGQCDMWYMTKTLERR